MLPTSSILAVFAFSFALAFGAVVSPGPVSAAIVTQAPRRGWIAGPLVASGHAILELVIVLLIAYGLTSTLAHSGIRAAIALVGGLLLLWMGASMIWKAWRKRLQPVQKQKAEDALNNNQLVGLGMVATLSNPFWYAWWVTVAAGYLAQAQNLSYAAVGAFYLGHISVDFAWDTLLSTVIGSGRNWITPKVYTVLILVCGGFLIYLGIVFLFEGITGL
jgi:threonine/homoserine/homoserine lactone efflux protein